MAASALEGNGAGGGLEQPVLGEGVPARGREWHRMDFKFPSNRTHSVILSKVSTMDFLFQVLVLQSFPFCWAAFHVTSL